MPEKFDKKILAVLMEWDYCDPKRGPSMDKEYFYKNLAKLASSVEPFWYDPYINDLPRLQEMLLEKAKAYDPDLIFFVPYLDQFTPETLDFLKERWPTFAWFGDDTWRFELNSAKLAPHFTHVGTTDPFSVLKYKKIGIAPILTQWAAQLAGAGPGPVPPGSWEYDVSFVGGYNRFRAWYIEQLAKAGIKVHCFGAGWPAGKVSFEEMERIFYKTKINLNLSNSVSQDIRFIFSSFRSVANYLRSPKRAEQIKARNFEIPLAGGFQLTNYVAGIERYLKIGEEVAVFSSPEECALQIEYYLANEAERIRVLAAGNKRAASEHTYLNRLGGILAAIWG
ncbi:MAG: glycosyltransferase [Elusimicrobiota bacterium]|nr:glycosyltransferase [Elusimicrobiota bacterium]